MLRKTTIIAVITAAATLVAACGGNHATPTDTSAQVSRAIEFARCMRSSGVPSYPDSGADLSQDLSGQTLSINGVSVNSPAFHSALRRCDRYISSGASINGAQRAKFTRETLKVARCMRAHGIESYPDSGTFNTTSALNPQAPAFRAASKKCGVGIATGVSLP
jgi:hypothetical protein